ncbi:MAG: immunity 50 family protein [Proteobacteria bacterium]|nr:immunity 50 family protein [Pseudomonadota bacterium]
MSWIDALDNNYFLKTLYPTGAPILDALRLHEVQLHQDGPAISLRFDLNEYPAQPPAKWQAAKSNTVQVRLMGIGVREFVIHGWTSNNIGRLVIKDGTDSIILEFEADKCHMTAVFNHLRVDSVTAYRDELRGST